LSDQHGVLLPLHPRSGAVGPRLATTKLFQETEWLDLAIAYSARKDFFQLVAFRNDQELLWEIGKAVLPAPEYCPESNLVTHRKFLKSVEEVSLRLLGREDDVCVFNGECGDPASIFELAERVANLVVSGGVEAWS
jgi:hypothetical protein